MECIRLSSKDYQTIRKRINTGNLTDAEIQTAVNLVITANPGLSFEALISPSNIGRLNSEIGNQRNIKIREKRVIEKPMIGNAEVKVSSTKIDKGVVRNNPETLYIFTDNLQAYNVFAEAKIAAEGLIDVTAQDQIDRLINVDNSSAIMRTNIAGEKFPNSLGFVVKKNAVKGKRVGDFTNEDADQFQDTPEDRKIFHDVNMGIIQKIKEMLSGTQYDKVVFPAAMASSRARLPKALADDLVNMLEEELGVQAQAILLTPGKNQNWQGEWYSVELSQGTPTKAGKSQTKEQKERAARKAEAQKSAEAERPILDTDVVQVKEEDKSILSKELPDIEKRKARVDYLNNAFSQSLSSYIISYRAQLAAMSPEDKQRVIDEVRGTTLADIEKGLTGKNNTGKGEEQKEITAEQRIFALSNITQDGMPLADYIFANTIRLMQYIVDLSKQEDGIAQIAEDILLNPIEISEDGKPKQVLTYYSDFQQEAYAYDWSDKKKKQVAYQRAKYLAEQYATMLKPEVFEALKREMAFDLEFNENIRLDFKSRPVETKADEEDTELNESNVDANKEGYMIKYKLLDPAKTLSVRMKTLLASLYVTQYGKNGWSYVFDDLGGKVRMNPTVAYYILLDELSAMTRPEDMDKLLEDIVDKYPWLNAIIDKIKPNPSAIDEYNPDLRKEFYTTFRKSQVRYGMTTKDGSFTWLNRDAKSETFLMEMEKSYEGRLVYGDNPIYNEDGQCNEANVKKMNNLLRISGSELKGKKGEEKEAIIRRKHPLAWALSVLKNQRNFYHNNKQNIIDAIKLLRGDDEFHTKVSLEALLNNLGINTSNMNLESILPYVDDIDVDNITLNELCGKENSIITPTHINRISTILNEAETITRQTVGETGGFHAGDHLLDKFQNAFLKIGSALTLASDGYTQATFRHGSTDRFTYAAPDMIATMVNYINSPDRAKGDEFIEETFGRFDLFKNQVTGEWMNTWMEQLAYKDPNTGEYPYRDQFGFVNILSLEGNEKKNMIGSVGKDVLIRGAINMYFSANDDAAGRKFAYYRCPLFSDVDALVMLQHTRYTDKGYQQVIISKLAKVLQQEIDRINHLDSLSGDDLQIEFYNKNGKKLQFFPELNYKLQEILQTIGNFAKEGPKSVNDNQQAYLEELVMEVLLGKENETGQRSGGKLQRFIDNFSDEEKKKIYRQVTKAEKKKQKESAKKGEQFADDIIDIEDIYKGKTEEEISKAQLAEADDMLEEFFYNDFFAQSQIIQILGSDLAYYKNFRDFIKRNKQAYACGERMYARDEKGEPLKEHCLYGEDLAMLSNSWSMINTLLAADKTMKPMERDVLRGAINSFKSICSTDGQSLRTMKSFRKIFQAMGGKWTDAMEESYNRIRSGQFSAGDFLALWHPIKPFVISYEAKLINGRMEKVPVQHKNSEYMLNAIYTMLNVAMNSSPELLAIHQFMEDNDIDVFHFHSVIKEGYFGGVNINYDTDKFTKELDKVGVENGKLKGHILVGNVNISEIYHDKEKNKDVTGFDGFKANLDKALTEDGSITQAQYNEALKSFRHTIKENPSTKDIRESSAYKALQQQAGAKDEKGEVITDENNFTTQLHEDYDHVIPLDDYMIVQPSGDHLTDEEALFGSQLRNIIPADLPADFTLTVSINGKEQVLNREQAIQHYNRLITDQLLDSFSKVDKEFSDITKLQAALLAKMDGNVKYGPDVKAALELTKDKRSFKLPFNSPNLTNKIEELILSTFKNAIQKQRIKGGNVVLVSNYGLSDSLHVKWKNARTGELITDEETLRKTPKQELAIDHIPCLMPLSMSEQYKDFLIPQPDGSYILDFERVKKSCPELLDVIGYRIPTEDKYSAMPMRVVGFMPACSGTTIMLPSDIVTMSGTDFDIDKLFLMIKAVRRETYKSDLRQAYANWINGQDGTDASIIRQLLLSEQESVAEYKKAWEADEANQGKEFKDDVQSILQTLEDISDSKILKKLSRSRFGLTDQEVQSMRDESELFDRFMEEEGYKYLHKDGPSYIVRTPRNKYNKDGSLDLDSMSRYATAEERNNMLIDTIWGTLTSNAGSTLSMLPGSFSNVKHASRMQRILHDKNALAQFMKQYKDRIETEGIYKVLGSMDIKTLDRFYDTYATIQSPMDILDYADNHRNLMDGNDLIGMFAVNSSNHYKFQFLGLKLKQGNEFRIKGVKEPITLIDAVDSPITGVRIGRMCAEFQAASPDNGKDPCLGDLNANSKTVSRIGFLLRIGMDAQTIGMINTSSELVTFGKSLDSTKSLKLKGTDITKFEVDIDRITTYYADLQILGKDEFMNKYNYDDFQYIKDYAVWMKHVDTLAGSLNQASCISRSDSTNGAMAVSIAEATQQRLKAEDFMKDAQDPSFPIEGLDRLVDAELDATHYNLNRDDPNNQIAEFRQKLLNAKIPRLQAAYTLGHKSAHSMAKKWLVQMDDNVYNLVKELRSQTKQTLTWERDISTLKAFYTELTMFAISKDSVFSGDTEGKSLMEKRNYYLHDFPMKLKMFLEEKNKDGTYKHKKIRELNIIQRLSNLSEKGIKFKNVGKVTPVSRKHYTEELESLLYMGPEEAKLAFDLFMYAYYDTGLSFRHNSYGIFFTTMFMRAIPRYVDKLNEANNRIMSDPNFTEDFVNQFLINHPDLITKLKSDYFTRIDKNTIRIVKNQQGLIPSAVCAGVDSLDGLCIFVKIGEDIYTLTDDTDQDNIIYTKMDKLPENTLYYDANTTYDSIDYNALQGRGVLSELEKKKNDSNTEKESKKDSSKDKEIDTNKVQQEKEIGEEKVPQEEDSFYTPEDGPNDVQLNAHADALDAVEFVSKQAQEKLEKMAIAEQTTPKIFIEPTEKEVSQNSKLNDLNEGPTTWCP